MAGRLKANEKVHYVASSTFVVDRKYSNIKLIGKGSYGVVCSAIDTIANRKVAIKKISPMAKDVSDAKHVLREIRLMRYLGIHENIIALEDLMIRESADELYIVMELLDSDLHRVIQSSQELTDNHIKHFMHQLVCGVKYLHDNRIIHRDLKPGNLLVNRDCRLRITDFGLARERPMGMGLHPDEDVEEAMTENVVTRWYRPPELMLCPDGLYGYSVDMWSCGCIFAELLGRRPLFPGKNFIHQLTLIFDVLGAPLKEQVMHIQNSQAKKFLASQAGKKKVPFELLFPEAVTDAVMVLVALLNFEPEKRYSADETLAMRYFSGTLGSRSRVFPKVSPLFEFEFERLHLSRQQLKQLIVNEGSSIRHDKGKTTVSETIKRANELIEKHATSVNGDDDDTTLNRRIGGGGGGGADDYDDDAESRVSHVSGASRNSRRSKDKRNKVENDIIDKGDDDNFDKPPKGSRKPKMDNISKTIQMAKELLKENNLYEVNSNNVTNEPPIMSTRQHLVLPHGSPSRIGSLQSLNPSHVSSPHRRTSSPSRKNDHALRTLEDENSSNKAMALLHNNNNTSNQQSHHHNQHGQNPRTKDKKDAWHVEDNNDTSASNLRAKKDFYRGGHLEREHKVSENGKVISAPGAGVKKSQVEVDEELMADYQSYSDDEVEPRKTLQYSMSKRPVSHKNAAVSSQLDDQRDILPQDNRPKSSKKQHDSNNSNSAATNQQHQHHQQPMPTGGKVDYHQNNIPDKAHTYSNPTSIAAVKPTTTNSSNHVMNNMNPTEAIKSMYISNNMTANPSHAPSQHHNSTTHTTTSTVAEVESQHQKVLRKNSSHSSHSHEEHKTHHQEDCQQDDSLLPRKDSLSNNNSSSNLKNKNKLTVPKSPHFSKMSWERRHGHGGGGGGGGGDAEYNRKESESTLKGVAPGKKEKEGTSSNATDYKTSGDNKRSSSNPHGIGRPVVASVAKDPLHDEAPPKKEGGKGNGLGSFANPTQSSIRYNSTGRAAKFSSHKGY